MVRWAGFQSGLPVLELDGPANASYTVMVSTNLIDWTDLETVFVTEPPSQWFDLAATDAPQRFYRIRVE